MGIYDRDYYRQGRPGFSLTAPRTAVVTLILINVAVYFADALTAELHRFSLQAWLSAYTNSLTNPLHWWQFLTYGFVHSREPQHIIFNMLGLWFLGRDIEDLYGRAEFTRLYLVLLVVGSVSWAVVNRLLGHEAGPLMGASGAIAGIVVLYALNFPRRIILFMFVLPMPAWVFGLLMVAADLWNASLPMSQVAYGVHLAGAAFAFLYYQQRWNFSRLMPGRVRWPRVLRGPKLRLHQPDEDDEVAEEEVDRILEKIHREGESSLTRKERRLLEHASREYQRRRRGD